MRGTASPQEMRILLGKWTWACLLRRCLLSELSEVYSLCAVTRPFKRRPLRPLQMQELETLLDLFPLMYADLNDAESTRVYASDACRTGGGVTYCDLSVPAKAAFLHNVRETKIRKG